MNSVQLEISSFQLQVELLHFRFRNGNFSVLSLPFAVLNTLQSETQVLSTEIQSTDSHRRFSILPVTELDRTSGESITATQPFIRNCRNHPPYPRPPLQKRSSFSSVGAAKFLILLVDARNGWFFY